MYLCLRGEGAPYQLPTFLQPTNSASYHNFQVWNGSQFADGEGAQPIKNGSDNRDDWDYWFRLQPPPVLPYNNECGSYGW